MKRKVGVCLLTVALVFICLSSALGEDRTVPSVINSSSIPLEMSFGVPKVPIIISTPVTAVFVGNRYIYDVDAIVEAHSPAPTYTLITHPADMTIDPISGSIEWVPENLGDFDVSVKAFNLAGADIQSFTITVREHPQASELLK
ncbi:MAG: putative Ig domain-containing protein [Candidatus Zixiibacteriota bacterium]